MTINQTIGNLLKEIDYKDGNAIINIYDWEKLMFAIGELQGELSFYEMTFRERLKEKTQNISEAKK
jgi:hypothetical protein